MNMPLQKREGVALTKGMYGRLTVSLVKFADVANFVRLSLGH